MRIREVRLNRFKRFTDTTVTGIPETARLVVIAGPNGCGKSSFFEALNLFSRARRIGMNWAIEASYYFKALEAPDPPQWNQATQVDFHGAADPDPRKWFYIRSAYRNDPEFQNRKIQQLGEILDEDRLPKLIMNDATVANNYSRLAGQALQAAFEGADATMTIGEFRDQAIGEIRDATKRLFPDLIMNSLGNPLTTGTFKFDKGKSKGFLYGNLSGGEKAAFDLLLI